MNRTHLAVAGLLLATLVSCSSDGSEADSHIDFCLAAQSAKDAEDGQQRLFSQSLSPVPADVKPAVEGFATKFTDAQDRFRKYVASTCGITITTDPSPTSDLTTTSGS